VLDRARAEILRRKAAGLHADMGFTYRNLERSTDPQRRRRSTVDHRRGGRTGPSTIHHAPAGAPGRIGRYAWVDHYKPLRRAARDRPAPPARRAQGGGVRRRQLDRRP
jgi:epoxyqueuosine reductase